MQPRGFLPPIRAQKEDEEWPFAFAAFVVVIFYLHYFLIHRIIFIFSKRRVYAEEYLTTEYTEFHGEKENLQLRPYFGVCEREFGIFTRVAGV